MLREVLPRDPGFASRPTLRQAARGDAADYSLGCSPARSHEVPIEKRNPRTEGIEIAAGAEMVKARMTTLNQRDEVVQLSVVNLMVPRRPV